MEDTCAGYEQPLVVGAPEAAGGDVLGPWNLYGHHSRLGARVPAGHPLAPKTGHPESSIFVGTHSVWQHQSVILGVVYHHALVGDGTCTLVVGVTEDASGIGVHVVQDVICWTPPKTVREDDMVEPFQNI